VAVLEELQILAHDEGMEQLFVNEIEIANGPVLPRVVNGELQRRDVFGLRSDRKARDVNMKLGWLGHAAEQRHAATAAGTGVI
jgi:hypothetical protein